MLPIFEPPTLELDEGFVVATGIECSAPTIGGGVRQDELRKTGHWERYAEDFSVASSMGLRYIRWGVPFHVVARSDDAREFDWGWTDAALDTLRAAGLEPILDLLHFGRAEVWNDAMTLRAEGQPIRGFCWYGLVDHVDWDSGLTRNRGQVNHCGLIGLDRRTHRVGRMYGALAHDARQARYEMVASRTAPAEIGLPAAA